MLLKNDALKKNPILRRMPGTPEEWTRWIQTLDAQKVVEIGAIVLAEYIRQGQTAYDTGTGFWLGDDAGTPKVSIGNSAGAKVTWDGSVLSVTGAINATSGSFTGALSVGSSGSLSSGQTAYDTGTGYWLEYNAGTPRFSLGNSAGNKLTWNGTTLAITGNVSTSNSTETFTPTWGAGFSTDPTGDFSYIDFGAYVLLFSSITAAGASDAATMSISNLPSGIRPSSIKTVSTVVVDNSITEVGFANVSTDGNVFFFRDAAANFTTGDVVKNWPAGALLVYPK